MHIFMLELGFCFRGMSESAVSVCVCVDMLQNMKLSIFKIAVEFVIRVIFRLVDITCIYLGIYRTFCPFTYN